MNKIFSSLLATTILFSGIFGATNSTLAQEKINPAKEIENQNKCSKILNKLGKANFELDNIKTEDKMPFSQYQNGF